MSLFSEIQSDILSNVSLATVMRKAKVLAYRLKNQEFKTWVDYELSGYYGTDIPLPDYRILGAHSSGTFFNGVWKNENAEIPLYLLPKDTQEYLRKMRMHAGIRELEALLESTSADNREMPIGYRWEADLLAVFNTKASEQLGSFKLIDAKTVVSRAAVAQILDNIRNRLLSFILELADRYPEQARTDFEHSGSIPDEQIHQVFNVKIMGSANIIASSSISQEAKMTVFDQRNQNVNYQYNAAGDINFDSVDSPDQLITELEKLKIEISRAAEVKVISDDAAIDAKYQIDKAIQQTKSPEPSKKTILQHIEAAKEFIGTVTSSAGMIVALTQAADAVQKVFK